MTEPPSNQQNEPAERQATRTRGGDGRFARSAETALRDAQAAELRAKGWTYRRIGEELGLSPSNAHEAVQRAMDAIPQEAGEAARRLELERLDQMFVDAQAVLKREHVHVSMGKVIRTRVLDDDGNPIVLDYDDKGAPIYKEQPLVDDGPVLHAIDRLLKISERRAKLLGLDAPMKVSAEAEGLGAEIAALITELGGDAGTRD